MTRRTNTRAGRGALLAALLAGTLLGCRDGAPASDAGEAAAPAVVPEDPALVLAATSGRGTFAVELRHADGTLPLNAPFDMELRVTDAETGAPLAGVDAITLDARMPAHKHGMLRDVALVDEGDGVYRADGMLLHMVGLWAFQVDVQRGAHIERAEVDYELQH